MIRAEDFFESFPTLTHTDLQDAKLRARWKQVVHLEI
jgi:uncharacterized protein (DUF433 family)